MIRDAISGAPVAANKKGLLTLARHFSLSGNPARYYRHTIFKQPLRLRIHTFSRQVSCTFLRTEFLSRKRRQSALNFQENSPGGGNAVLRQKIGRGNGIV